MKKTYIKPWTQAIRLDVREHLLSGSDELYKVRKLNNGGTETVQSDDW